MNSKDKLKRLKHLMYNNFFPYAFDYSVSIMKGETFIPKLTIDESILDTKDTLNTFKKHNYSPSLIQRETDRLEIYTLSKQLNIDLYELWFEQDKLRKDNKEIYIGKPQKEGRDNKDVYVGSGYPQRNTIRYPKKNRKTAWKRFYKLFPKLDPKNKKDE